MSKLFGWRTSFQCYSLLLICMIVSCNQSGIENLSLEWKKIPAIPPKNGDTVQYGLAGPVAGSLGGQMIVAGGANFPDSPPWRGGTKLYHDEIYLLKQNAGQLNWEISSMELPYNLAYPACTSISEGVVSIGGENQSGLISEVLLFTWTDGHLAIKNLPGLPEGISSGGATSIESRIYLAGGLNRSGAIASFWCLDQKNLEKGWTKLPDLPLPLSHAVVVSQNDQSGPCIYVIGGRNKTGELSAFMSSVWKYQVTKGKWVKDSDIQVDGDLTELSAGTGFPAGKSSIVLIGGDKGVIFNQIERLNNDIEKAADPEIRELLQNEKDTILTNHPGFSRDILVYNTISKVWKLAGETPVASPVTTSAFFWNGMVIIPSGEIRPGVRTPDNIGVEIKVNK
ncbi:MAG: hypothetical protein PHY99_05285 [Bacteroidales bacterium]|nr:hypothetical protein [Bacteroidales bacterium]